MDNEQFKNLRYTPKADFFTLVNLSVELFSFYTKKELDAQKIKNFSSYFLMGKIVGKIGLFDLPFFLNLQNSNPEKLQEPIKIALEQDTYRLKRFADLKLELIDFYESILHIALNSKKEFFSFSTGSLAQFLQISRASVVSLILSGDIPAFKIGTKYRVESSDLQAFILANRIRPYTAKKIQKNIPQKPQKQANTETFNIKKPTNTKFTEKPLKTQNNAKFNKPQKHGFVEKPDDIDFQNCSLSDPPKKAKKVLKEIKEAKEIKKVENNLYSAPVKKNKSGENNPKSAEIIQESGDLSDFDFSGNLNDFKMNLVESMGVEDSRVTLPDSTRPENKQENSENIEDNSENDSTLENLSGFNSIDGVKNDALGSEKLDKDNKNISESIDGSGDIDGNDDDNNDANNDITEKVNKNDGDIRESDGEDKEDKIEKNINEIVNKNDSSDVEDVVSVVAERVKEKLAPTLPYQENKLINKPKASVRISNKKEKEEK